MKPKRFFVWICTVCLILCLMPATSFASERTEANGSISYLDANGSKKTAVCTVVTDDMTQWTDGWYAVKGTVTFSERVGVEGNDINVILCDGAELNAGKGIGVHGDSHLNIYAQSDGDNAGSLHAYGANAGAAAIGGNNSSKAGTIIINGGNVQVNGSALAAGIGSGSKGSGGTVVINGGTVTTNGGEGYGAGIGSGYEGSFDSATINGGTVIATGGTDAAGIGKGYKGSAGSITINGGSVTATGGDLGAGLGSNRITLNYNQDKPATSVKASSYTGTVTLSNSFRIEEEEDNLYYYYPANDYTGRGEWNGKTLVPARIPDIVYVTGTGETKKRTFEEGCAVLKEDMTELTDGWYLVTRDIEINERIIINGSDINLILFDDVTLTTPKGITVNDPNGLTIWAQSTGDHAGALNAECPTPSGSTNYCAIGGLWADTGTIVINGGKITAAATKWYGAGIGGHQDSSGGNITINGGDITATGGASGAGIGGGLHASGGCITINGGNIKATGGTSAAGIGGGGYGGTGGTITINGGTVEANGGHISYVSQDVYMAGIGNGQEAENGNTFITLNYDPANPSTCVKASGFDNNVELAQDFTDKDNETTVFGKTKSYEDVSELAGRTLVPLTVSIDSKKIVLSKTEFTYNGKVQIPEIKTFDGEKFEAGTYYTVTIKDNKGNVVDSPRKAGTYTVSVTGKGIYTGTAEASYKILSAKVTVPTGKTLTYNGKKQTGVAAGANYTVSGNTGTEAGTYKAALVLKDKANYIWDDGTTADKTVSWEIVKTADSNTTVVERAANPLKVKGKTVKIKYSKIRKKSKKLTVSKVIRFKKKGEGKLSYKIKSAKKGKKSYKKYFKINSKTGKLTVKKGLKKGTYKVKAKVKAAGTANYNASGWKKVTITVKVK